MSEKFFSSLNYTLANEDNTVEVELVKRLRPKHIVSVCGSGGRAIPLAMKGIKSLTCVDLVEEQLALARLRLETIKRLSYDDFLFFWGYPPFRFNENPNKREELFRSLKLTKTDLDYFVDMFMFHKWQSLLYIGKWERTFRTFSKIAQKLLGKDFAKIFDFTTIAEQKEYYNNGFKKKRWLFLLFILGNKSIFNALLYKGHFVKKNIVEGHFEFYKNAFERLLTTQLARESFFLELCFYGEVVHSEALTIEAKQEVFNAVKENVESGMEIRYVQKDLVKGILDSDVNYDFASLSNVPSYFSGEMERDFLQLILPRLNSGAVVVYRSYLRVPEVNMDGFDDISDQYHDLTSAEKVQMFKISVLRKK
ncbi:MAG: DUF3419 family protein [Halobacteriovoraceae bacterium]|jgi:S-adenosylmethionine-diacylglycerol 3-amino-3-carboxypropyl transferase|nr:DUF3419 family protein [Halobacteriovoraceae bacterium]